jgi:teichuronic acid biosynthesis glycosyltransferase TuaC
MRILFVTNYQRARAANGSAGIFVDREMQSLREGGLDVSAYDIGTRYDPASLWHAWRGLRAEIRRTQPDLLHAQYGTIVAALTVLTGHPTVITFGGGDLLPADFHSGGPDGGRALAWALSWLRSFAGISLSHFAALFAVRTICVSEELRRSLHVRRRRASVIPRGVDLKLFSPGSREEARAALGWTADARIVLASGTGDRRIKGLDVATEAAAIASRTASDLELRVIRDIPPDQMPLIYRAADVLVFASRTEGSPNVVKEALACGLPVIGVHVGDVGERLHGVTPSATVARAPRAIADAIVEITRNPERSNGPQAVAALSLEKIRERILDVYRDATRQQARS